MTYDDLSRALTDPMTLMAYHLDDLLELCRQYPYCEALHRLLLIDLYRSEDVRFPAELKRRLLYLHDPFSLLLSLDATSGGPQSHSYDLIDRYVRSYRREEPRTAEEPTPAATTTGDGGGRTRGSRRVSRETEAQIVQDFLDEGPEAEKIRIRPDSKEDDVPLPPDDDEGPLPGEELFTEKLAMMYASQERYTEAMTILKALNLKYPEKSGYFAERMSQLQERRKGLTAD
jgi:hypothetical protein